MCIVQLTKFKSDARLMSQARDPKHYVNKPMRNKCVINGSINDIFRTKTSIFSLSLIKTKPVGAH